MLWMKTMMTTSSKKQGEDNYQENPQIRGAPLAMLFMRTFFRTLVREWGNMDKYRVDKFLHFGEVYGTGNLPIHGQNDNGV